MKNFLVILTILCFIPLFCMDVSAKELDRSAFTTTIETQTADEVNADETSTPTNTTEAQTIVFILLLTILFSLFFIGGCVVAGYLL